MSRPWFIRRDPHNFPAEFWTTKKRVPHKNWSFSLLVHRIGVPSGGDADLGVDDPGGDSEILAARKVTVKLGRINGIPSCHFAPRELLSWTQMFGESRCIHI